MTTTEDRVTILLNLLDDQLAESLINDLPEDRRARLQERLAQLDEEPPSAAELEQVLEEFEAHMRQAFEAFDEQQAQTESSASDTKDGQAVSAKHQPTASAGDASADDEDLNFVPSSSPLDDLNRIGLLRLSAALRGESSTVISLIANCLTSERAGEVLQRLASEVRDEVFLKLKEKPNVNRRLLEQIARAVIEKACSFDQRDLVAENVDYERKIVQILRSMERKQRNELLASLEEKDEEVVARLREMMYSIADVESLQDRTIQKLLADLDTGTLVKVLKDAPDTIQQRIFDNLSRRAREGLLEELDLTSSVGEDERNAAEKKLVEVLIQLDQRGELAMIE